MVEIIESSDSINWSRILNKIGRYDFYHTSSFHKLEKSGETKLFVYNSGNTVIVFPIVIRKIENSQFFDLTSVYGYPGPLSNSSQPDFDIVNSFQKDFDDYLLRNNIVAAFTRLNPLLMNCQEYLLNNYGTIQTLNTTVSINLDLSLEEQRQKYDKSLKHKINQLRNKGVEVCLANTENEIEAFHRIYIETMDRVSADKMYYFPKSYFKKLCQSQDFECFILLAKFEGEIIAGSCFTICCDIMQYHLSGTKTNFLKMAPMKIIIDEARMIANSRNLKYLHLGGGYGGSNDTLFEFKTEFSDQFHTFKVWKKIVNENVYNDLVFNKFGRNIPSSNYFPLYRLNESAK